MRTSLALFVLALAIHSISFSQRKNEEFKYYIQKTPSQIIIDGKEDPVWGLAQNATDFQMVLPMDTSKAKIKTDVKMFYDSAGIYIIAINYIDKGQKFMVESLKRDFSFGKNDNFLLFMDPFNDQTNGFTFGSNAAGAQWDGLLYEGGKADLNWDNKWNSAAKYYEDKWIWEAYIPFKTIRYRNGIKTWGIQFSRLDISKAEKSSWAPVPRQFPTASLAYTGMLVWDQPPPDAGQNISLIPYVLTGGSKNYTANTATKFRNDVGLDAKVAVTSSLNLDLSIHPDFSQVEVDRQVTNLDRFELFFPERRQFFIENGDQFNNFGYGTIRPFFSRRIGLNAPIQYGARLSGKLNKNWRMGFMNMQTERVLASKTPVQNYTAFAIQRKVFARSNIGLLFVNRDQLLNKDEKDPSYFKNPYNRNIGLEYNLASSNNLWTGKYMLLKSFSKNTSGDDFIHAGNIQYSSKKWLIAYQQESVGKQFTAEVGYVPRKDYFKISPSISRIFFSKNPKITSHTIKLMNFDYFTRKLKLTDNTTYLAYTLTLRNQATYTVWMAHDYIKLLQPFDPTNYTKDTLARGTQHQWNSMGVELASKPQQLLTYLISGRVGGYYFNGKRSFFSADLGYRVQPYFSLTMSTSYNNISLPAPWNDHTFWLIGPRIDVTFTNKLFFTTFIQYNNQQNNINLNTRFQWRYKPASDLFLVYTDNYFPAPFNVKNRALVLKFNYWWNL
ncbi:MAG: hydrolase [Chitinophagia bacterium]|nr:hydrolase [Chitinophagia bacterium]